MNWKFRMPCGAIWQGRGYYSYRKGPVGMWIFNEYYHRALASGGVRV